VNQTKLSLMNFWFTN